MGVAIRLRDLQLSLDLTNRRYNRKSTFKPGIARDLAARRSGVEVRIGSVCGVRGLRLPGLIPKLNVWPWVSTFFAIARGSSDCAQSLIVFSVTNAHFHDQSVVADRENFPS
jgi:hypothetical protein